MPAHSQELHVPTVKESQQLASMAVALSPHCCPWAFLGTIPGYTGSDGHAHSTGA